jgi:hypothetical protein
MDAKYEAADPQGGPTDFKTFFPYYLREHAHPLCRALHYIGTTLVIALAAYAIGTAHYVYLWGLPVVGYFFAWVGHFFIEKNKPATFTYPFWSLIGDFKMYFLFITRRMGPALDAAGARKR